MSVIRGVLSWFRDAFGPGPRTADGRRTGGSMDIKRDRMVFLGYGKYWRSDAIIGLMPIEEERGPKRRTNVFVEGRVEPIIARQPDDAREGRLKRHESIGAASPRRSSSRGPFVFGRNGSPRSSAGSHSDEQDDS